MVRDVCVDAGSVKYAQTISVGPHVVQSDEPTDVGGNDAGPNPEELLMVSLGACMNMTVQMYAERHRWSLEGVKTDLSYASVPSQISVDPDTKIGVVDQIEVEISFAGNLSEDQLERLLEIAGRCPVHRMLARGVQIETTLVGPDLRHPS